MTEFSHFYQWIVNNPFEIWLNTLPSQLTDWRLSVLKNPKAKAWLNTVQGLPELLPSYLNLLDRIQADISPPISESLQKGIENRLKALMPWRKGPFSLYGIHIDSEWRSNCKWKRILPHLDSLVGKKVLDVGCANGYHLWRMLGAGARLAIGVEPMPLFFFQFMAVKKLLGEALKAQILPLRIENIAPVEAFDTVFSMGVLYHRRSPLDHLYQLKNQLRSSGQLVLETLVIDGNDQQVLIPEKEYAKMRNVYFIPSVSLLKIFLKKCGFIDVRLVDVTATSTDEQRRTCWMTSESLLDFLDPEDHSKTIEGYPAPFRAILTACKP
ncbi:tRNA 5-methoxyuridine(34)/uridine 5-oxyacetic acid(34) synthase CmoB [Candidatus Hamiltonella endosymbiont of Tuberolachnus salignus]|uniref:tRNA 5-methoxyuridine(34)/uridine 5-oxyacetic acid(34) synthase CmoB n=1 Tax=Candidatus Williamhamiltonella endosymbiont of Tuberolachnus salignus TaxID=3077954 RepID=UPI0030CDD73C